MEAVSAFMSALKTTGVLAPVTCQCGQRGYDQAEAIVGTGDADFVALTRIILYDPRWPWHAAAHLGATVKAPKQYLRSQPSRHRHLFDD